MSNDPLYRVLKQLEDWISELLDQNRGESVTIKRRALEFAQLEILKATTNSEGKQVPAGVNRQESPGPGRETL